MNCSKWNLFYNEDMNDAIGRIQGKFLWVDSIA